jgi:hypothetical protein
MNTENAKLVKYIGSMYHSLVGGYLNEVVTTYAAYGGNLAAMMRDLSGTASFRGTLANGTDRDVAHDLINRLVGDKAAGADHAWAVDWFVQQKAAGLSWGEAIFQAVSALDVITTGPWAAAAAQMRNKAAYSASATEGWAANVFDLGTLRDVYSFALDPVITARSFVGQPPLVQLNAIPSALATAAAGIGSQAGAQNITLTAVDAGRVVLLGGGNDTVSVGYADLTKPAFISGGDGIDTLVITAPSDPNQSAQEYVDFINSYRAFAGNLPIRGFEHVVFERFEPRYIGALDGLSSYTFKAYTNQNLPIGRDIRILGLNNDTTINIEQLGSTTRVKFGEMNTDPTDPVVDASSPQLVDKITFNVNVTAGPVSLVNIPAKNVTLNIDSPLGGAYTSFVRMIDLTDPAGKPLPNLESLTVKSNINQQHNLIGAPLKLVDLTNSTGRQEVYIRTPDSMSSDGLVNSISVVAPKGLFALNWATNVERADTFFNFTGEFKAGSNIKVTMPDVRAVNLPITKAVFNADFSEIGYYNSQPTQLFGFNLKAEGSVFDVTGVLQAAAYFKGVAPAGKTIGTAVLGQFQFTTIKVDSAAGIDLKLSGIGAGVAVNAAVINSSGLGGSVIDNVKASLAASLPYAPQILDVAGGRILWVDMDSSGGLSPNVPGDPVFFPYARSQDFVLMETTSANLGQFTASVQALGLTAPFDPFL